MAVSAFSFLILLISYSYFCIFYFCPSYPSSNNFSFSILILSYFDNPPWYCFDISFLFLKINKCSFKCQEHAYPSHSNKLSTWPFRKLALAMLFQMHVLARAIDSSSAFYIYQIILINLLFYLEKINLTFLDLHFSNELNQDWIQRFFFFNINHFIKFYFLTR